MGSRRPQATLLAAGFGTSPATSIAQMVLLAAAELESASRVVALSPGTHRGMEIMEIFD